MSAGRALLAEANLADLPRPDLAMANFAWKNLTATTDPTTSNDITQGYYPGMIWINATLSRSWECQSNAVGAATWILSGVVPGVGAEPASMITQAGSGTGTFREEGNVYSSVLAVGAGVSPGATSSTDYCLAVYALPANSLDIANRGLTITAAGSFGSTSNNKTIKIYWGATTPTVGTVVSTGTVIATTGTVTTNGGGWQICANVFKYGATGSNTQLALHSQAQVAGAVASLQAPVNLTATESAIIYVAVTGQTPTATSDIVCNWVQANFMN